MIYALLFIVFFNGVVTGQSRDTLYAITDNTIYEDSGGLLSNGSGEFLFCGTNSANQIRRALIGFDVAARIPPGAQIVSVQIKLHMSRTISGARTVRLHRLSTAWGEGGSDATGNEGSGANADTLDATWFHNYYPQSFWQTPGGDYDTTWSAELEVSQIGDYVFGSTDRMVTDVQIWLESPEIDFGYMLIGDESQAGSAKRFNSRQNTDQGTRPVMIVEYNSVNTVFPPETKITPESQIVLENYPNPFNPLTTFRVFVSKKGYAELKIFDVNGKLIQTLFTEQVGSGWKKVQFDAAGLASGAYLAVLYFENQYRTKKLLLLK